MKVSDVEQGSDWDYNVHDTVRSDPGEIGRLLAEAAAPRGTLVANTASATTNRLLKHIPLPNLTFQNGKNDDHEKHPATRHRHGSRGSRKLRRRVVFKNGDCNIAQTNVAKRRRRYLADIFTTLVDIKWRWTLIIFTLSFMLSWLGFAMIWWIIAFSHGDLEPDHLPANQELSSWTPCVREIDSFASCFLFSVETQHTIGYGSRHTTEECPEAIFIMCIQSISGVMIQALMVGIVFAKISRPKKRTQTLMFSRNAVICMRDNQLCLMFRVGDMRKSHIICANVRAQLIRRRTTDEGEIFTHFQHELKVGADTNQSDIFFIWPMVVVHKVDQESPLYTMSASDLLREKFEIVVILEGVIESTGMTTQARSSYLPNEILWGHRFDPLVTFRKEMGAYAVDYSLFNTTYEVDTPLCSAKDWDVFRAAEEKMEKGAMESKKDKTLARLTQPLLPTAARTAAASIHSAKTSPNLIRPIAKFKPTPIMAK